MKKFDNYRKNLDVLRRSDQQDLNNEFIISGIIDISTRRCQTVRPIVSIYPRLCAWHIEGLF